MRARIERIFFCILKSAYGKIMKNNIDSYVKLLRDNGLKATPKRKAVIDIMLNNRRYYSPMEVWENIKCRFSTLGLTSVYRILESLENIGIVTTVEKEDRRLYYFLCTIDNYKSPHHHFICRSCHGVRPVNRCHVDMLYTFVEEELGCKPEAHYLQIEGLCRKCRIQK